jgi:uncharacterized protein YfaS (alpha-2-macroglobulin family)
MKNENSYRPKVSNCQSLSLYFFIIFLILLSSTYNTIQAFEPTNSNQSNGTADSNQKLGQLTIQTDKQSYRLGDVVLIEGNVKNPTEGKTIRIDVYTPESGVLYYGPNTNNSLTNVRLEPDSNGVFSFNFTLPHTTYYNPGTGTYTISATYLGNSSEAKINVR